MPASFPEQLKQFSGPQVAFTVDGKAWDAHGIGGPSNVVYLGGNYWVCTSGFAGEGNVSQAIGCWFGPELTSLKPYPGNPILVNSFPKWAVSCIEGPTFNVVNDTVYLSYVGFSTNCDDEGHGVIGFSSTTTARFPDGFTMPSTPQIPEPPELSWLFRSSIIEINGICYDYSNAGSKRHRVLHRGYKASPIVASFKTNGPCATTEMDSNAWKFNRYELTVSQPWEGKIEVEEPQVFRLADGTYAMLYGGAWSFKAGFATAKDPTHGGWTKSDTNPIRQDGILWLPRIVQDTARQYWMFGNFNNTPQMSLWKGVGPIDPNKAQIP